MPQQHTHAEAIGADTFATHVVSHVNRLFIYFNFQNSVVALQTYVGFYVLSKCICSYMVENMFYLYGSGVAYNQIIRPHMLRQNDIL